MCRLPEVGNVLTGCSSRTSYQWQTDIVLTIVSNPDIRGGRTSELVRFLPCWPCAQPLFDDLARHFQISRNAEHIGTILVNLIRTDFSFGLATDSLDVLRGNQDALLAKMAQIEVNAINRIVWVDELTTFGV